MAAAAYLAFFSAFLSAANLASTTAWVSLALLIASAAADEDFANFGSTTLAGAAAFLTSAFLTGSLSRPLAFGELSPVVCSTTPFTVPYPAEATAFPIIVPPEVNAGSAS